MQSQTSRPRQALWNGLKPQYKLVASSPCVVGILMLLLAIFPGGWLLAALLGISANEPVNQNRNGSIFMLSFCALIAVAPLVGMGVARRVVSLWLVRFSQYSPEVAKLALTWRAYPEEWFATSDDR